MLQGPQAVTISRKPWAERCSLTLREMGAATAASAWVAMLAKRVVDRSENFMFVVK
jgi:hypothetical protein